MAKSKSLAQARTTAIPLSKTTDFDKVGKYNQDRVNGFDRAVIESYLELMNLESCSRVLDAMSGDGNLTENLFVYCAERGIRPPASITTLELSPKQSAFAREKLASRGVRVIHGDILTMTDLATHEVIPDNHFDLIMLKSGNHEIPIEHHPQLWSSLFRVLAPGGRLVNLGLLFDDPADRDEFRHVLRVKDSLAGLHEAAANRYILTRQELYPLLRDSGFADISSGGQIQYIGHTSIMADAYFKTERDKLKQEYERTLLGAGRLRSKYRVLTQGNDSVYIIPGEVTIATKPKLTLVR